MADKDKTAVPATAERVVQVERRDYPEIAPDGAPRTQSLDGFDRFTPTSWITSSAAPTRSGTNATSA